MHPKQQIQQDLKTAMKAGDAQRRDALRMLMAAFKQVEVDKRIELSEDDALGVLMSEAKKLRESVQEMSDAGRTEEVEKLTFELSVIESYLPQQLTPDEIETLVRAAIDEVGATTPKDTGKVMKVLMPKVKGQADGKQVNAIVQKLLAR
ncbi:MAG: GatB/YqeY domain-containing protein [Chloroflexi bacterium]|nr:GatB/YqeY domain-containing protein [Chloroflexota bacterium]